MSLAVKNPLSRTSLNLNKLYKILITLGVQIARRFYNESNYNYLRA